MRQQEINGVLMEAAVGHPTSWALAVVAEGERLKGSEISGEGSVTRTPWRRRFAQGLLGLG
jgi:hypothetical protein